MSHPASLPSSPRRMTRCECLGVPFDDVARRIQEDALSPEEALGRTGCGSLCTACLPDLRSFLAATAPGRGGRQEAA